MTEATIIVRLFSVLRERTGTETLELSLHEAAVAGDVADAVIARYPVVDPFRRYIRVAVNTRYVDDRHRLKAGDEVALITPVSGG